MARILELVEVVPTRPELAGPCLKCRSACVVGEVVLNIPVPDLPLSLQLHRLCLLAMLAEGPLDHWEPVDRALRAALMPGANSAVVVARPAA